MPTPNSMMARKRGLEEKCGEHFIGEQRARDVANGFHVAGPVGAELETHGDAADDAERKGQCKHLHPEAIGLHPVRHRACGTKRHLKYSSTHASAMEIVGNRMWKLMFAANWIRASMQWVALGTHELRLRQGNAGQHTSSGRGERI